MPKKPFKNGVKSGVLFGVSPLSDTCFSAVTRIPIGRMVTWHRLCHEMKGLDMSETYTIYAPGAWVDDIEPAMEDWHARTDLTPEQDEVVEQYWDNTRVVK